MRWLLPLAAALRLASFGASGSVESNLTYFGAPRLSLTGVTPTLEITEGYILAQTNTTVATSANRARCSAASPCVDGSCCNSDGLCGYRPEHCRPESPASCVSDCDATAPCGESSADGMTSCPLNLCCSYFGFCGTLEPFCRAQIQTQTGLDAPCQGNCGNTRAPSCGENSGSASRRIAYYEAWNLRRRDCDRVMPNQLDTPGLTHLVLAFASINPKTYEIRPMNPEDEAIYAQFLALPGSFRKIIGVGGWEFSDPGSTRYTWSDMTSSQWRRKAFINSLKQFISVWKFSGIDIDWEWPGASDRGGNSADKENQIALVTELRKAMGTDFSISVVFPAQYEYLKSMDPAGLQAQVDWLNILAYDLHGPWDANVNGLGPYIKPHTDLKEIEAALELLWSAKVTSKNVVMGLANYGRGYVVEDEDCMWFGCKFTGPSRAGECTKQDGVLSTCEIRRIISQHGLKPKIIDGGAGVKEIAWDNQWVGYDDAETFDLKLTLANNRCLGGTALWAIDYAICDGDGGSPQPGSSVAPAPPVATGTTSEVSAGLPASSHTSVAGPRPPSQLPPQQSSIPPSIVLSTSATASSGAPLPPVQSSWSTAYSSGASNAPWSSAMSSDVLASSDGGSSAHLTATNSATGSKTPPSSATSTHASFWPSSSSIASLSSVSDSQVPSATTSEVPSSGSPATSPTSEAHPTGVPVIVPTASSALPVSSSSYHAGSSGTTTIVLTATSYTSSTADASASARSSSGDRASTSGSRSPSGAVSSASVIWPDTSAISTPAASQSIGKSSWIISTSSAVTASSIGVSSAQSTAIASTPTSGSPQSGSASGASSLPATSDLPATSGAPSSVVPSSAASTTVPSSTGVIVVVPVPDLSSDIPLSSDSNVATWSTKSTIGFWPTGGVTSSGVGFTPPQGTLTTASASGTLVVGTSSAAPGTTTVVNSSNGPVASSTVEGSSTTALATSGLTSGAASSDWRASSEVNPSGGASMSDGTSTAVVTSGTTTSGASTTDQNTTSASGTLQGTSAGVTTDTSAQGISTTAATSQGSSQGTTTTPGQASSGRPATTAEGTTTTGATLQSTSQGATTATSVQGTLTTATTYQSTSDAGTSSGATSEGAGTTTGVNPGVPTTTDDSLPTLVPGIIWDSDSHSDSDPECKPNDCIKDCIAWRAITFLVIKRPLCPCVPHTCDKKTDNKKKKCKFFGCGCGWMGLSFGPGCSGIDLDITGILPPGGLFGDNPCRFFGCPGSTPGLIGSNGYCYGLGCDPCPPEVCSGNGPSPGPNPTQPSGRPKECEEKDKTRVTERFVYCTENFNVSVSAIPSSILGTASTMISTVCVPMIEATLKVCPGAMEGYATTTTTTLANTVTNSSGAPACTKAPLSLDDDEGSNDDPLSSSITYSSNTTQIVSSTSLSSSSLKPSSSSVHFSSSLVNPSSSSGKPSSTSKKPGPTPLPAPFDRNGKWKAKITVTMERKIAQLAWVLFDPNGDHAGEEALFLEDSQLTTRIESKDRKDIERSARYAVTMIGTDLLNVDKARVAFTIEQPMQGCNYANGKPCTPTMTTENRPETKMFEVDSCEFYCMNKKDVKMYQADLWCDDLNDAMWLPKNAGFERVFWCGWKGY